MLLLVEAESCRAATRLPLDAQDLAHGLAVHGDADQVVTRLHRQRRPAGQERQAAEEPEASAGAGAEPVTFPGWVLGTESAALREPRPRRLQMFGLGGRVATPAAGITAPVLVVTSWDALAARQGEARGKIVLEADPARIDLPTFRSEYHRVTH